MLIFFSRILLKLVQIMIKKAKFESSKRDEIINNQEAILIIKVVHLKNIY